MQITRDVKYLTSLEVILDFIAKDSFNRAVKFLHLLDKHIDQIPNMPYKYRQSYYFDATNVRDLICKGYTIPYLIDIDTQTIVVLDIFKWSKR